MDGVLLIDKPTGPTSHDVVARMRRVLGERAVGHTGTLDPMATGLLVLVIGKATRLASLLTGGDKTYDATVRLGFRTSTDDAHGLPVGPAAEQCPSDANVHAALERFRGTFQQMPPAYSAKSVGGTRAYELARKDKPVNLTPVDVTVRSLEWQGREGDLVFLRVQATAGFYVRALARDLGAVLGCGGHLAALRRVRSGSFGVEESWELGMAEKASREAAEERLIEPASALPALAAVQVNEPGLKRVRHGNPLGPAHLEGGLPEAAPGGTLVKILSREGRLLALAEPRAGALHPVVVLG